MEKKDKILITGSKGMVGKNLIEKLDNIGYNNLLTPSRKDLDLRERKEVFDYFNKENPKYVFHLAAKVGGIKANMDFPVEFLQENLLLNTNVIDASYYSKVKKLVNLGSSCIYPKECFQPMKEESILSGAFESTNEGYAISKISSLKLCEFYNKQYNSNFISLIPPNMYGKFEKFDEKNSHVLASLLKKFYESKVDKKGFVSVWGDGTAKREFLYAKDMAEILIFSMNKINSGDLYEKGFLNCGSSEEISIENLARLIKKVVEFEGEIIFDYSKPTGMDRKILDSSRFLSLGFNKFTSLIGGIKETYEWYKNLQ